MADVALLQAAVSAAATAKQVILVLNLQSRAACDSAAAVAAGGEYNPCGYEGEQHDRPNIALPKHQAALALAVLQSTKAAGVPAVVVLVHGGQMSIESVVANAPAILDAHYPGEATGALAIADALYGAFSPAGKLSDSIMPKEFQQSSNFASMDMVAPPGRTYKYYPSSTDFKPALFSFGFGLTYTKFNFTLADSDADAAISVLCATPPSRAGTPQPQQRQQQHVDATSSIKRTVVIKNVGTVASDEVCELFFVPQFTRQGVPTPKKQLIDFERVHVGAGASVSVPFTINVEQLQLAGADGSRAPHPGKYTLLFTNGVDADATMDIAVQL